MSGGHPKTLAHHVVREVSFSLRYVLCRCGERLSPVVEVGPVQTFREPDLNHAQLEDLFRRHRTDVLMASRRESRL